MSNVGKHQGFRNNSGSLAMFAAILRASPRISKMIKEMV